MLTGKYRALHDRLKPLIPNARLISDPLRTLAYGTDASVYRYVPKLIVKVESEQEVIDSLRACSELSLPVTFRAAGTSLSGQACTDSVLILMADRGWQDYSLSDDRSEITLQAGVRGAQANRYLAPYGKRIGPDPASIDSAKIGGIIANNACGMASGIAHNSQYTLKDIRLIFADGTILDTVNAQSREAFLLSKNELVDRLLQLSGKLKQNQFLADKIRKKYLIKNTTGYSVNALIEHDDPINIIKHLVVGSEGTLAFISNVTLKTIDEAQAKATSLMLFPDMATACDAVLILRRCKVHSAELIDRAALRTVENKEGVLAFIKKMGEQVIALLIETVAPDRPSLEGNILEIREQLESIEFAHDYVFSMDPAEAAALWNVRKGIFPCACSERQAGTAVIIEDIAVPVENIHVCIQDLQSLFTKYGYLNCVIWGHVFDGNIHFVLTPDFSKKKEVEKYKAFMFDLADIVIDKYEGSLKAEHGTGRNMAPFVEKEWGAEIYAVMREIKTLFDPDNILNPGVLISDDPDIFIKHFKPMPAAHEVVDTCIECGFCERNCMSHDFTLSARQRIAVWREIERLKRTDENSAQWQVLLSKYDYLGDKTCAADGLCALTCPLGIDTGCLMRDLRSQQYSTLAHFLASWSGRHMRTTTGLIRLSLSAMDRAHRMMGTANMTALTKGCRRISGNRLPLWNPHMPTGATRLQPEERLHDTNKDSVVYFPACISRTMGPAGDHEKQVSLSRVTENLLRKAGYRIIYPKNLENLCCGMAFNNKGFKNTALKKAKELEAALKSASNNGEVPILCDTSPCLHYMKTTFESSLELHDPIEFALDYLVDKLIFTRLPETVALHAVCSAKKMGLEARLVELAEKCAEKVIVPDVICCGFAGDKGFFQPELNAFGLRNLKKQLPKDTTSGYSTSRTCEIGLSLHGGITYQSILYLVDRATRRGKTSPQS